MKNKENGKNKRKISILYIQESENKISKILNPYEIGLILKPQTEMRDFQKAKSVNTEDKKIEYSI